ncbi:MAG: GDSL-type esterase/lipase family protein [Desulfovibrio sp.]|jgi:lysophospholipase L1-like esterase|nr:GDSL-type esterase/lipase family protein [Desulfovibrio sp.]
MRVTCLGDSICFGYGVAPRDAWLALLADRLAADFPGIKVANAGVSGEVAREGLGRLSRVLGWGRPDLLYVQFGLNDAALGISPPDYVRTVREIVRRALEGGTHSVLVGGNHPVCVGQERSLPGAALYQRAVRAFNEALRREMASQPPPVFFADVERLCESLGGEREQSALLQGDGVHLSEEGNRAYARLLCPLFQDRLRALGENPGGESRGGL